MSSGEYRVDSRLDRSFLGSKSISGIRNRFCGFELGFEIDTRVQIYGCKPHVGFDLSIYGWFLGDWKSNWGFRVRVQNRFWGFSISGFKTSCGFDLVFVSSYFS